VGEEPFVVAVRRAFLEGVFVDPVQWQELGIFKFKPEEVQRLTVTSGNEIALTRGPNNEWTRAAGEGPVNQVNVQSLVNTLASLRAVRWVGGPMPQQAFDQVQVTISFTTAADDKREHKLIVGGPAGGAMWYGRVEGREGVFVLSNPDFNALRLQVDEPAPPPTASPPPAATEQGPQG
jgi:hypothetical protein